MIIIGGPHCPSMILTEVCSTWFSPATGFAAVGLIQIKLIKGIKCQPAGN